MLIEIDALSIQYNKSADTRSWTHCYHQLNNNNRFIFDILSHIASHPIYPKQFAKSTEHNPFSIALSLAPFLTLSGFYIELSNGPRPFTNHIQTIHCIYIGECVVHITVIRLFFWWIDFNFPTTTIEYGQKLILPVHFNDLLYNQENNSKVDKWIDKSVFRSVNFVVSYVFFFFLFNSDIKMLLVCDIFFPDFSANGDTFSANWFVGIPFFGSFHVDLGQDVKFFPFFLYIHSNGPISHFLKNKFDTLLEWKLVGSLFMKRRLCLKCGKKYTIS